MEPADCHWIRDYGLLIVHKKVWVNMLKIRSLVDTRERDRESKPVKFAVGTADIPNSIKKTSFSYLNIFAHTRTHAIRKQTCVFLGTFQFLTENNRHDVVL